MRCRQTFSVVAAAFLLTSCDPQKDALKLFSDQGLFLLKPLRTYVEVGGIMVSPRGGRPYYVDRLDRFPSDATVDPVINFDAVILKETKGRSVAFGSAVGAIQSILPVPLDVRYNGSQLVELAQMTSTGQRLRYNSLQSLMRTGNTLKFLETAVRRSTNRVFIVWEVYNAQSLTLKADKGFDIALGVNASAPTPSADPSPGSSSTPVPSASVSPKAGVAAPAAQTPPSASPSASSPVPSPTVARSTSTPDTVSGTWTRRTHYELSLTGTQSYPFAVRLAEVRRGPDGLELVPGGFRFSGTLAAGTDEEKFTAKPTGEALTLERRPAQ